MTLATLYRYQWLLIRLPIAVLATAVAVVIWLKWHPLPPTHLRIATASVDGAYQLHAKRYAENFAAHGITLDIQPSDGSKQNLEWLCSPARRTDLAFV